MIPSAQVSTSAAVSAYLPPDDQRKKVTQDFEMGGVAVSNPSEGLNAYTWQIWKTGTGDVMLQRQGQPAVLQFNEPNIQEITFAFDQNMMPTIAYSNAGQIYLRWYDLVSNQYQYRIDLLCAGQNPCMCLDDKRPAQVGNSDIILAYLRNGTLYYRQQRDRFTIERSLKTGISPTAKLFNVGMGTNLRLRFDFV